MTAAAEEPKFFYYFEPSDDMTDRYLANFLTEDARWGNGEVLERSRIRKTVLFETADLETVRKIYASQKENRLKFEIFRGNLRKGVTPTIFRLFELAVQKRRRTASIRRKLEKIRASK